MKKEAGDHYARKAGVGQDGCRQTRTCESPWREGLREELALHLNIENWLGDGQIETGWRA